MASKVLIVSMCLLICILLLSIYFYGFGKIPEEDCVQSEGECKPSCAYGEESLGRLDCFNNWLCCKKKPEVKTCLDSGGECKPSCAHGEESLGRLDCFNNWLCCTPSGV